MERAAEPVRRAGPPAALVAWPGWLMNRLSRLRADRLRESLAPMGISARDAAVLFAIDDLPHPVAQLEISQALWLDQGSVALVTERLEEAGLIERHRDPRDRRRNIVALTPKGTDRLRESARASEAVEYELMRSLSPQEQASLHRILEKLGRNHGIIH